MLHSAYVEGQMQVSALRAVGSAMNTEDGTIPNSTCGLHFSPLEGNVGASLLSSRQAVSDFEIESGKYIWLIASRTVARYPDCTFRDRLALGDGLR